MCGGGLRRSAPAACGRPRGREPVAERYRPCDDGDRTSEREVARAARWRRSRRRSANPALRSPGTSVREMTPSSGPSGTVTFLFTDIEDSTGLVRWLSAGYGEMPDQ